MQQRLNDSLDVIRQEYDILASDITVLRSQRDEFEAKCKLFAIHFLVNSSIVSSQVNELNIIRQALYDLETQHTKIRQQYEDELAKLRAEVHSAARQGSNRDPNVTRTASSSSLPYEYYRDRDRERDRERDRLADSREPKRLKVERRPGTVYSQLHSFISLSHTNLQTSWPPSEIQQCCLKCRH